MAGRVSFNLVCIWTQRKKFHFFTDNKTVVERNCVHSAGCTTYLHIQLTGSSGLLHRLCPAFSEKCPTSIFRVTRVQGDGKSLTLKMEVGCSYDNNEGNQGSHRAACSHPPCLHTKCCFLFILKEMETSR